jgi:hypothetical protein
MQVFEFPADTYPALGWIFILSQPQVKFPFLKVSTNQKRGGLKVVTFDRSPFKVFSLRFSRNSVQAPSCKRPKTTYSANPVSVI